MMKIIESPRELQELALSYKRASRRVALVPTMGYLHAGHLSLIEIAHQHADVVIVSIFVNPTQFGPREDLSNYPRDFKADAEKCGAAGVDVLFAPKPEAMYASDRSVWVDEEVLSKGLCGRTRPIHFRGVCTVVAKLFNLALPDVAVFGQKDAQQLSVIRRMVRDLDFPVEIIGAPLVREADGLALSSRNAYLSKDERTRALVLHRVLRAVKAAVEHDGLESIDMVLEAARTEIARVQGELDYLDVLDEENLAPATEDSPRVLIALAAKFGTTRLIDNMVAERGIQVNKTGASVPC